MLLRCDMIGLIYYLRSISDTTINQKQKTKQNKIKEMLMMEVIPMVRNASHQIGQLDNLNQIDFVEPSLLRGHSNDRVLV